MTRTNCDLASIRAEALLFSPRSGDASWTLRAFFYGSGRGLPGPVYKKAGEYPLSLDRQTDRDAFIQGRYYRSLGDIWSVAGRAKLSFNHLEYTDFPEFLPEGSPARYNYLDHSAYLSASAMARISGAFSLNIAQDVQYIWTRTLGISPFLDDSLHGPLCRQGPEPGLWRPPPHCCIWAFGTPFSRPGAVQEPIGMP